MKRWERMSKGKRRKRGGKGDKEVEGNQQREVVNSELLNIMSNLYFILFLCGHLSHQTLITFHQEMFAMLTMNQKSVMWKGSLTLMKLQNINYAAPQSS